MVKKKQPTKEIALLPDYLERLLWIELWLGKADELLKVSEALELSVRNYWDNIEASIHQGKFEETGLTGPLSKNLQGPYFLLIAYALENLFKAVIIKSNEVELQKQVLGNQRIPKMVEGHDLVRLARQVGLRIDLGEEDLLVRLSWNSVWGGRYPVPVDCGGLKNVKVYSDGKAYLTAYFSPNDVDRLNTLVQRVKTHVANILNSS